MAFGPITSWKIDGKNRWGNSGRFYCLGLQNHCGWWLQPWNWKMLAPWKKSYEKPRLHIKMQRHHFADKGLYSQSYGLSNSHVQMWEMDNKKVWAPKNWCLQTMVLEKMLESSLDCKEIKPVNPKRNQPWIFIGRTDAETETPILWSPDVKSQLIGKDPDLGKIEGRKRRGQQRMRWLDGITDSMDMHISNPWEMVEHRKSWRAIVHGVAQSQTWLSDWTTTTFYASSSLLPTP